jgi:hypothetical protein
LRRRSYEEPTLLKEFAQSLTAAAAKYLMPGEESMIMAYIVNAQSDSASQNRGTLLKRFKTMDPEPVESQSMDLDGICTAYVIRVNRGSAGVFVRVRYKDRDYASLKRNGWSSKL